MAYTKYSLTPGNNTAAPPDGAPEGMLPSAVNDTMRDMMAQIRDCGDGIRGGTYTMTAPVITGGSVSGITDLAIADGGTGASTAANARTNLGLAIGTNVQAWDADLDTWATKTAPSGTVVGTSDTQTLTNKTLTTPALNGSTSGAVTLAAPAVAGSNTATFPAATGTVMVSGNMPAFSAYQSSGQSISNSTFTKLQFNAEQFDTASAFDSTTNYRFQPLVAGYYQCNTSVRVGGLTLSTLLAITFYKNGSIYRDLAELNANGDTAGSGSDLIFFNGSTDYLEVYILQNSGTSKTTQSGIVYTSFSGCLVRSA